LTYVALHAADVGEPIALWAGAGICFTVRGAAIIWGLSLPRRGGHS
jgi:uncharacterized membrane protein YeiH